MDEDVLFLDSENSIRHKQLQCFGLPFEFPVEVEEIQKHVEGIAKRLFALLPLPLLFVPLLKGFDPLRRLLEQLGRCFAVHSWRFAPGIQLGFNADLLPA